MSVSLVMAELAVNTTSEEITDAAYVAAKKLILDTLGTTIAGHDAPGMLPILEQIREWGGKPEASVLVHGGKLSSPNAAYMNGCMAHALDLDDVHLPASLHIMSSVLPVALATAELTHASGKEVLDAVILGVEAAGRLGRQYKKRRQHGGFLDATIVGGFGTTAAACRILGMTVDQTVHALGLYYSQNCGNRQALYDYTLAKRVQPAWAARNAIWAAALAKRGVTGPHRAIEGHCGLFAIFGANKGEPPKPEDLCAPCDLFEVERTSIKRFASCGAMHPAVQAALDLADENDLKPDEIERAALYLAEGGNRMVGVPWELTANPQVKAQFCAQYCVALALNRRTAGLEHMTDEAIRSDTETQELAKRVELVRHWDFDPAIGNDPWGPPQVVQVTLKSGKVLECSRTRKDVFDPDAVTYEDATEKFHRCVEFSGQFSRDAAQAIVDSVWDLDKAPDIDSLVTDRLTARARD